MQNTKLKMWTGVGNCLLALTTSSLAIAQTAAKTELAVAKNDYKTPADAKSEGGEGGEGDMKKRAFVSKIKGKELLTALRGGGYVIFFRHAQTEKDYADQADPKLDLNNCATQRALNDKGIEQAKGIGVAFKEANIPVGLVLASDYCRAWKTADLAFGHYKRTPALNFVKAEEYTRAQKQQMSRAITPLLAAKPVGKVNTVIVGHDDVFDAATGIYPEPQGMAYILKPKGHGKFEILANMQSGEWAMLPK
jgi:phosphohistidine phosphatase SixA